MPYVQRTNGTVTGLYANPQKGYAEEFLADDNAEVIAFLNPARPKGLDDYQAVRRGLYRERILAFKNAPGASDVDAIGFVLDAMISHIGGNSAELQAIAKIVSDVKAEVPKP